MAEHIPFLFSREGCRILRAYYSDSAMVRVSLATKGKIRDLPRGLRIWADGGVDGLHSWKPQRTTKAGDVTNFYRAYDEFIKAFPGHEMIANHAFQTKPKAVVVKGFVDSVLNACSQFSPKPIWLSVPQLPMVSDTSRNKVNLLLAQSAAEWKRTRKYNGKLILPAIFTHQRQVNLRTQRKCELIRKCYEHADADGVWVVDSTLNDQAGVGSLDKRLQGLVEFHQDLASSLPADAIKIAGPYWGVNLVLWARGLIQYPGIGMGSSYQYRIPGPAPSPGKSRAALGPLRRLAVASPGLMDWLRDALKKVAKTDPAFAEFEQLSRSLRQRPTATRDQVAKFYKRWFDRLESVPPKGRALALYQDLSKAFVLGRSLQSLPPEEKTARRPDRVAQQLMLSCL